MATKDPEVEILPPEKPADPPFRMVSEREWLAAKAAAAGSGKRTRTGRRPWGRRLVAFAVIAGTAAVVGWRVASPSSDFPARDAFAAVPHLRWVAATEGATEDRQPVTAPAAAPVVVTAPVAAAVMIDPDAAQETTSQETTSQETPSQETPSQETPSQETAPQETVSRQVAAQQAEQNARIEQIGRNVDRMAAEVAANQAQITQLTAGQERLTHEILRLRMVAQSAASSASAAYAASHRPQHHALWYYRY